jgi:hypothetical protein
MEEEEEDRRRIDEKRCEPERLQEIARLHLVSDALCLCHV